VAIAVITGSTPSRAELRIARGSVTCPAPPRKLMNTASSKLVTNASTAPPRMAGTSSRTVMPR
jgi:hypothetical protein